MATNALQLLLVDDEQIVRKTLGDYLRESGHHVDEVCDGPAALRSIRSHDYDVALIDVKMPEMDGFDLLAKAEELRPSVRFVMITGHADMDLAIRAMRLGATDFLPKPVKLNELDAVMEKCWRVPRNRGRSSEQMPPGQSAAAVFLPTNCLVGTSSATQKVCQQIREAVEARCETILITGESGTGKEVVARQIHAQASSPGQRLVAVSCAAFTDTLVESELFGHVKGAFTGATGDRMGCFELANGSTLLLDEAGELSLSAQAKLLRVLETRTLRRVGGCQEIAVNVRVIAATNLPLPECVRSGSFRQDLYHRLNVYSIHLSPLRDRREDILPLAKHFLECYAALRGQQPKGFSPDALEKLLQYDFPGNARELRHLIERAAILCHADLIGPEHLRLSEASVAGNRAAIESTMFTESPKSTVNQERTRILNALDKTHWNRRDAARILAIPYSTLRYRMKKLGITK